MLLKACLNGPRDVTEHPALPVRVASLAADALACVRAGAGAIHLHPRNADGRESLAAAVVDPVVRLVRDACRVPVGVATGAWIEPDPERRAALVGGWTEPDFVSVNLSETGAVPVMHALLEAGIVGVEAGVWSAENAERLVEKGRPTGPCCARRSRWAVTSGSAWRTPCCCPTARPRAATPSSSPPRRR